LGRLHVLRVFANEKGEHGNPLGVFLDGSLVPRETRQSVAAKLGFSETVFVDDRETGRLQIFTPGTEFPFAGHPLVGTAWLMAEQGAAPSVLRPPAGDVPVSFEDDMVQIEAAAAWAPPSAVVQLDSPGDVDALEGAPEGVGDAFVWAWIDAPGGLIRARCFAPAVGIPEDEATGSAVLALAAELERPIRVFQGAGSVLAAAPVGDEGRAQVGGRVVLEEWREWPEG
jgi:predicted PhzF superfamily epimerase YddE/YHI9